MPLLEILKATRNTVLSMDIETIVRMAGKKLIDGGTASAEFRQFLAEVAEDKLGEFANYCLDNSFVDSGQVLQDIVNEIGRRLSYTVQNGRYNGVRNEIGFDGIWSDEKTKLVVEVKTTDVYTIRLDTIALYRDRLAEKGMVDKNSPILLVIGRNDTQSLEAQVRGSRHAWSMRIVSIDALIKLMNINLATSTKEVTDKIHLILEPIEYTRVDGIVDVVFTATEDKQAELEGVELAEEESRKNPSDKSYPTPQITPKEILDIKKSALIDLFGKKLEQPLVKRKNSLYAEQSGRFKAAVIVSKHYENSEMDYWYGYNSTQRTFLADAVSGYMILGMVDTDIGFAVPFSEMEVYRERMNTSIKETSQYWHVKIVKEGDSYFLKLRDGNIDLEKYKIEPNAGVFSSATDCLLNGG
jgi:hypothetical protein